MVPNGAAWAVLRGQGLLLALGFLCVACAVNTKAPSLLQRRSATRSAGPAAKGQTHLLSFRQCSRDASKPCSKRIFEQMQELSTRAAKVPSIERHHLFQGLPPELAQSPKFESHLARHNKGWGFWFWKPALLNLLWSNGTFNDGDTVIWDDADDMVYIAEWNAAKMFKMALANDDWDIFAKDSIHCEAVWTKGDVFELFGVPWYDKHYGLTRQAHAQFFVVRLNSRTRRFMQHWEDLAADFHLISFENSRVQGSPRFRQHRHDQSLLSMLLKANLPAMNLDPAECKDIFSDVPAEANRTQRRPSRHPRFGVEGLRPRMGSFRAEAQRLHGLPGEAEKLIAEEDAQQTSRRAILNTDTPLTRESDADGDMPPRPPRSRTLCVRGACYDLDALPPGFTPPEVAAGED